MNARCEAVICLLSSSWATSAECHAEYRQAEGMHKPIFCARIEAFDEKDVTRAWQSCDLFGDGPAAEVVVDGDEQPVRLQVDGLHRLLAGLRAVGIGADSFAWPPPGRPGPLAVSGLAAAGISRCRSLFRTGRADRACAR